MVEVGGAIREFLMVAFKKQTYLNILYLLFSFPLGTAYFIFLVTGLSFGFGLLIVWVGIPVLLLIFLAWWEIASFERQMAIWLLGTEIPSMYTQSFYGDSILNKFIQRVKSPVTWKALIFLLLKFPLGIFSLVLMVVLLGLTLTMLFTPVLYLLGVSDVNSALEAFIVSLSGMLVGFVSLHVLNMLAIISGNFARIMLGSSEKQL
ncbi:sensor domain-containing protein [Methanolobus sediminis]|uniref:Sensor domain-containing protein n=1 Tax=Methanolobus sediminis TaxID=3072978 RepID=A0AA51YJU5_9EURY|nr:sensor domain-containing protein [Methanolobus sediminis]WMW25976.1 sensor domain-containing protein [Methanolobus sediminis]